VPFRMGIEDGGARSYMAAYNAWNGVPMTVNPILKNVTIKEWGVDGIIYTDAGSLGNLVNQHKAYPDLKTAVAAAIKAGINMILAIRVAIAHGQSKTVSVPWKSETVAYWDEAQNRFIVEPGQLTISVGASSADARLKGHLAVQ
jgi:hypothetical protein